MRFFGNAYRLATIYTLQTDRRQTTGTILFKTLGQKLAGGCLYHAAARWAEFEQ